MEASTSSESCLQGGEESEDTKLTTAEEEEEADEYIQRLVEKETSIDELPRDLFISGSWIQEARSDAIKYILDKRGLFGFSIETAYLSVKYFDRFLSRRSIDGKQDWAIRLLSIACLSLAAKMEECRVPSLLEYPMELYKFESKLLHIMELLVLNELEWRMGLITPIAFTRYFVMKFSKNCRGNAQTPIDQGALESKSMEIMLRVMEDIKLIGYRSYVLAAAATLLALDQGLKKDTIEVKINALPRSGFIKIDDLLFCYNQMRGLDTEEYEFIESIIVSPPLSPKEEGEINGDE
ncbi:PREDICTED: cyclin-D5-2-like [Ipomoea nil]|uniref:cyclin-D5-2-like n=1 Tax=Ipomoea nil TaxID=35883 RepID=UPI0009019F00|nr:PREDICTED: cyclin-D5-2-like [Ipomoea nil]